LTPDISRQVAAQFGGILEEVLVKPGEVVEEGQLLAKLDGKEIGSKLAEAIAEREVARKRRNQARAKEDISEYQLAGHEFEALALRVQFLQYQKENLDIRSPITGLILTGDLERSKGVPVETGQKLFEVAAFDKFVVEIAVVDEDINWVKKDQEVALRLESRGGQVFESKVEQIYPVSEVNEGDNVFVCLGYIYDEEGRSFLRPGMRGRARIKAGWQPLGWVIFHKPYNYVKVRFF
ncbi:MAG: efflux RND transporter periplasmic adaptor subunit, partial [Verrucomicrobiales bacterium]|nr:efflux RND transporter periplasmic adaptor subunit [Verrucomicrobiales bacterium]